MNRDWHATHFNGVVVDIGRQAAPPEATRLDGNFLEGELDLRAGSVSSRWLAAGLGRPASWRAEAA